MEYGYSVSDNILLPFARLMSDPPPPGPALEMEPVIRAQIRSRTLPLLRPCSAGLDQARLTFHCEA